MFVWTCRQGFERDLIEELGRVGALAPRLLAPALVASDRRPTEWPVFARAGFPLAAEVKPEVEEVVAACVAALDRAFAGKPRAFALVTWVPDADETNPLSAAAQSLGDRVAAALASRPALAPRFLSRGPSDDAIRYGGFLLQICLVAPDRALVGAIAAQESPTLAPGGRDRTRMPADAPSRAGRKLAEAFSWIGRGPEPGELCVDLGAAPGGWTAVLLDRRCRVIAVDPAELAPEIRRRKGVTHIKASAFDFAPDAWGGPRSGSAGRGGARGLAAPPSIDWLLCDMAWRPLEVAALLAKWGRRRWANAMVANVKLPMKQRVEHVERVTKIVAGGGWRDVRARQLYHDREEVTLSAWRT